MNYRRILVTGGAGFIGSSICLFLKELFPHIDIVAFDNLIRRGSENNLTRLAKKNIDFVKGDVRNASEIEALEFDLLIECSAEPSVLAGIDGSPSYVIDTNLFGANICFERARKQQSDIVFLSTSRVYPYSILNKLKIHKQKSHFCFADKQNIKGVSEKGISEEFPLIGTRSMYGATKLSAEILLHEYCEAYGMKAVINRYGLVAGPWQMGKSDQGIIMYWLAAHEYGIPLKYIGYDGLGYQTRDVLHINDLLDLLLIQLKNIDSYNGLTCNVGGGKDNAISLKELTDICEQVVGNKLSILSDTITRKNDVICYITDNSLIHSVSGWKPKRSVMSIVEDTYKWLHHHSALLHKLYEK